MQHHRKSYLTHSYDDGPPLSQIKEAVKRIEGNVKLDLLGQSSEFDEEYANSITVEPPPDLSAVKLSLRERFR